MSKNRAKKRFRGYVQLAALDRKFLTKAEERRLLEDGIAKFDLDQEDARGAVLAVARDHRIRIERDIDEQILPILERYGGKRRKIRKKQFNEAAAIYNGLADGTLTEEEARIGVKRVMEKNGFRPKRSRLLLSRRWYNRIGRRKPKKDQFAA